MTTQRTYYLTRPEGTGLWHNVSIRQGLVAAAGLFVAVLGVKSGHLSIDGRVFFAAAGLVIAGVGFMRRGGEEVLSLVAPAFRYLGAGLTGGRRWIAPLSPLGGPAKSTPPWLAGLSLRDLDLRAQLDRPGGHVALIEDSSDRTVSVVMRAYGEGFIVANAAAQDTRIAGWGEALADTCRDGHPVARMAVSQWAAPAGSAEHRTWLDRVMAPSASKEDLDSYAEVLEIAGQAATRTEVLLTLSIAVDRVRLLPHHRGDKMLAAADRAVDYAGMLRQRLAAIELVVSAPLTPVELATVIRTRCDPSVMSEVEGRARALGELAGVVAPNNAMPLGSEVKATSIRLDGTAHRVFRVAEWPRTEVAGDWLRDFLGTPGIVRSFTVLYIPRSTAAAKREVGFRSTMSAVGMRRRDAKGNRISAEQELAHAALRQIDTELAQGAGLLYFVGLVTVAAPNEEELDYASEQAIQAAQHVGMELRLLHHRQGAGMAVGLCIGRGVQIGRQL